MPGLRRILPCALAVGSLALPAAAQAAATGGSAAPTPGAAPRGDVPAAYLRLYRQAARRYRLDWRLLAAIGKNESDHGRSPVRGVRSGLNFAGCCAGPMQLCTVRSCGRTWQSYAVDGDRDGRLSVYDPADAIFTAAHLLGALRLEVGARADFLLASYNAGPAYVLSHGRIPPYAAVRAYVASAIRYMRSL